MLSLDNIFRYSADSPILFNQYLFLFLFTLMFGGFALLHKRTRVRNIYLLLFSLFFYFKCSGLYFVLLLFSTIVDYLCGQAIYNSKKVSSRRAFLIISVFTNLGLLGFFKYSYFFTDTINTVFSTSFQAINFLSFLSNNALGTIYDIHEIILPVGISFYTFQTLSYSIDIYRRNLEPCKSIFDFAFFVSFFPQLVAGPIVRASEFIPQIRKPYFLSKEAFGGAVYLILCGLIKKVIISDYISVNFVDRVFDTPEVYSGFMNLMAVYGYSIQIYCDFSGYSDMAIGLAALLGFQLPLNFNSPYKSYSITEFWRRWHISLSSWLRDYLYISLGGNRKGKNRTYINLMLTMLLGGLWHGAAFKFIIWGGLHGLALAVHKIWANRVKLTLGTAGKVLSVILTFHFVALCWIYFRADNIETVGVLIHKIFTQFDYLGIYERVFGYWKVFLIMLFGFVTHLLPSRIKESIKDQFISIPLLAKVLAIVLIVFVVYQSTSAGIQPFIYFQF